MPNAEHREITDVFIIGGGVNGCGIARDAAGRGLNVKLAEMNDLASATSSASTKLFHGGLRYLDYFKFRLVREALAERETLLKAMPHISWPMRFILPYHKDMRFDTDTPATKLLHIFMPWLKGRRPAWLIRMGLFLYDHLGGRKILPATSSVNLKNTPEGAPLKEKFVKAYEYSDCWVEDSRLVVLNARDAQMRGAKIMTYTKVQSATVDNGMWRIETRNNENREQRVFYARVLINAAGPWVGDIIQNKAKLDSTGATRLVRGSHIITRKIYPHDKCYFFQGADGRIIFAIPYETDFTLIGTTDCEHNDVSVIPVCTDAEADYLLNFANAYFNKSLKRDDIVWSYSGVRPLYDDGSKNATAATRDYILKMDTSAGPPMLNIFGGKITTYRRLSEAALDMVGAYIQLPKGHWTAGVPLPGGDFAVDGVEDLIKQLKSRYDFLSDFWARRLVRAYGTDAQVILGNANSAADLGRNYGASLTEAEVNWLIKHEFARTAEDIIWRRNKLGLRLTAGEIDALTDWMALQRQVG